MFSKLFKLRCPDCGKVISEHDDFCPGCGTNLNAPLSAHEIKATAQVYFENAQKAFENGKNLRKALDEINLALQFQPDSAEAYNLRGLILDELGNSDSALEAYRKAVQLNPNFEEAKANLEDAENDYQTEKLEPGIFYSELQTSENDPDMSNPMDIEFFVAAPDEITAKQVEIAVTDEGYRTRIVSDVESGNWYCCCIKKVICNYRSLMEAQRELEELIHPIGVKVEGWGTFDNNDTK